jgi:tetratricopeptide (TPR) repeat protein
VTSKQDVAKNLLRQGLKLHAQGQTSQAERLFRRVLTIDPRNADAFFNLGSIAESRQDLISALTNYRAALNLKPSEHDFQTAVAAVEKELNENSNQSVGTGEPASQRFTAPSLAPQPAIAGNGTDIAGSGTAIGGTGTDIDVTNTAIGGTGTAIDATDTALGGSGTAIAGSGTTMVPFQLKSTQFDSLLNVQTPTDPLMNVSSPLPTPTLNVSSNPRVVHKTSTLNAIFSVGVGVVLQGSGLHCPICRIMSGLK